MRYSFKVAWLYEFQGHNEKASRHYRIAYNALSALSCVGVKSLSAPSPFPPEFGDPCGQVKGVADYANFKICRLALQHNRIREAATQIQTHLWHFRKVPASDAPHQHWGWLSRQHVVFAQLIAHHSAPNLADDLTFSVGRAPWGQNFRANQIHESKMIAVRQGVGIGLLRSNAECDSRAACDDVSTSIRPTYSSTQTNGCYNHIDHQVLPWLQHRETCAYAEPLYHYAAAAAYAATCRVQGSKRAEQLRHPLIRYVFLHRSGAKQPCSICLSQKFHLKGLAVCPLPHLSLWVPYLVFWRRIIRQFWICHLL